MFKYVVEKQSGRNRAWFWLGKAYYELKNYDSAVHCFSKVIDMMGDQAYCNPARGLAYLRKGDKDAANEDLNKALPWMIDALASHKAAFMFEYADAPLLRDGMNQPSDAMWEYRAMYTPMLIPVWAAKPTLARCSLSEFEKHLAQKTMAA